MLDFEKEFDEFVTGNRSSDPITTIYNLYPNLSDDQVKIFMQLKFMADKYQIKEMLSFLESYMYHKKANKNMNFTNMLSFRKTLESYSLTEHLKGVKVASQNSVSEER